METEPIKHTGLTVSESDLCYVDLHLANERRCYFVTMSLIGWVQA